ncbi:MAG TPA: Sir2 family NAD-dependent protein deacetylase [Gammaproteobacteria bacterium]|nr:Sir2 family NAD-dependent protein deacetylase [Gammaproteobacteria bacterium]
MVENPDPGLQRQLAAARELLAESPRVAAFSGAGLSAESGLATFRDPDSDALWSRFDPTELASLDGFQADPRRVVDWYDWRRNKYAAVAPNAAHRALASQTRMIQITQNVDHLLEQAGVAPERIYHLHGDLLHDRCHNPDCDYRESVELDKPRGLRDCPRCGEYLRPAVVWFGEPLPRRTWDCAERLCAELDCLLVIGTSATVYPAAGLIDLVRRRQSRVIVVDPNPGAASHGADVHLAGPAARLLPALLEGFDLASTAG